MHRFTTSALLFLGAISAFSPSAKASAITSAMANVSFPCTAADKQSGTSGSSVNATCSVFHPEIPFTFSYRATATARVTGTDPFSTLSVVSSLHVDTGGGNLLQEFASAGLSQLVAISGGNGSGTVAYEFQTTGSATGDETVNIDAGLGVVSGGASQGLPACGVSEPTGFFLVTCNGVMQTAPFAFTFNSPFILQETLSKRPKTTSHLR
jgi:hypothetical protein